MNAGMPTLVFHNSFLAHTFCLVSNRAGATLVFCYHLSLENSIQIVIFAIYQLWGKKRSWHNSVLCWKTFQNHCGCHHASLKWSSSSHLWWPVLIVVWSLGVVIWGAFQVLLSIGKRGQGDFWWQHGAGWGCTIYGSSQLEANPKQAAEWELQRWNNSAAAYRFMGGEDSSNWIIRAWEELLSSQICCEGCFPVRDKVIVAPKVPRGSVWYQMRRQRTQNSTKALSKKKGLNLTVHVNPLR